jgi:hypothetical protein
VGAATNNFGELWAIGMVLNDVALKVRGGYAPPATGVILTDSSYVCGCLTDGWEAKGPNAPLVHLFKLSFGIAPSTGTSPGSPATPGCSGTRPQMALPLRALGRAARGADSRTSIFVFGIAVLLRNCNDVFSLG